MRIVNRETLLNSPNGTIFQEYEPYALHELRVFHGAIRFEGGGNDYVECSITDQIEANNSEEYADAMDEAAKTGKSIPISFNETQRNGCFDYHQLYAIWDAEDIRGLIDKLTFSLNTAYKNAIPETKPEGAL